jgi:hypothetical protein
MASSVNPRRSQRVVTRSAKDVDGLSLKTNMSLRKSPTFHSPTSASSSDGDFAPPLIRRSQTNLDDVVDAHRRRVALIVDDLSKSLVISDSTTSMHKKTKKFRDNSLPVPPSFLDLPPVVDPAMAKDTEPERRQLRPRNRRPSKNHASDSGLGTSIASTKEEKRAAATTGKKASTITRSASSTTQKTGGLNQKAVNRIHEHTLRPLLAKATLKDFRPIVLDIPRRISENEIICLRDLEKTLVFMAPVSQLATDPGVWGVTYRSLRVKERAKTSALYLDFCLTSIRCIKATAGLLNEREQTRPRDRPYTNLYFMDLEEQIRQYARQLAQVKEKSRTGTTTNDDDEMDLDPYEPTSQTIFCIIANSRLSADEVRLYGGVAKNGRQPELVRVKKDGRAFSMATGKSVELDEDDDFKGSPRLKRSLSASPEDDDDVSRSMARRKKNPTPEELAPKKCREPGCNKEFKRPCDLTKHEKTHSRPWKCPHKSCKYHEYGWPTEKECDRHQNDKHEVNPATYECHFKPCTYKSKRESNCKQHMEKSHGWTYVRTKTNGRKPGDKSSPESAVNSTPQLTTAPTPTSHITGVHTPPMESTSPFMPFPAHLDFPQLMPREQFFRTYGPHAGELELDDTPMDGSPVVDTPSTGQFEHFSAYDSTGMGSNFIFNDEDLYTGTVQIPTPASVFAAGVTPSPYHQTYTDDRGCHTEVIPAAHISPIGQANAMLFTPKSLVDVDEGFEDFPSTGDLEHGDFQLYPTSAKMNYGDHTLFGEMPSAGLEGLGFSQQTQQMFSSQMDWQAYTTPH